MPLHLAIHQADSAGCGFWNRLHCLKNDKPVGEDSWHRRCFRDALRFKDMKKLLLLPLVALGLIAWTPTQAKAGVTFGFNVPVPVPVPAPAYAYPYYYGYPTPYYGYPYSGGYYPGYADSYYYAPHWYHGHRDYHRGHRR
jgi:hypothetical protein